MASSVVAAITAAETRAAQQSLKSSSVVVRTPLIKLNHARPDLPDLEIFLKLETLQPINSFKIRGAMNALQSVSAQDLQAKHGNLVVSASAGNMGQGVAFAAKQKGAKCVVVVPDHAPQAKTRVIEEVHQGEIVRVPFSRWWEILETRDASRELGGKPHLFVHPVVDRRVIAGNSTIGAEILEDLPDVEAVYAPWGGGGLCCGIGSALRTLREEDDAARPGEDGGAKRRRVEGEASGAAKNQGVRLVSCEPVTAGPLHHSLQHGEICTQFEKYQATFIDGCGGKSVLAPMWPLAKELVDEARVVEIDDVKEAIRVLADKNKVIAEGAGAIALAAVLYGPKEKVESFKKVVCVVCGGCIDRKVLVDILDPSK